MTDRYAVIGNPVAHSKSPLIHAEFARACRQDMAYTRIEAPVDGFTRAVDRFRAEGGRGLNVTLPFKGTAFAYCTQVSERAKAAQAANTLVLGEDVFGDTTDGVGLVTDLEANLGFALRGSAVLLLGAGGAAQSVAGALIASGVARLAIANRTPDKARSLAARHPGADALALGALEGERFDLVVNATSAGLSDAMPAIPPGLLRAGVLAYDMVYGRDTAFLRAARAGGAAMSDGLGMLVEQAAASFEIWRGVRPDTRPLLERLRAG